MTVPDFVIIGAMKCGTSTLAAQLSRQSGVFVTDPKEPNFFSDDPVFAKGRAWYESLYKNAPAGSIKGEASTHYTKLPTYPNAAQRLYDVNPMAKLIYITRDPIERLVSHYIHEWTMGVMTGSIDEAIYKYPELIAYSRYDHQLQPWRQLFPEDQFLHLSLDEMERLPAMTLERVGSFIGCTHQLKWRDDLTQVNISTERIRRFPGYAFFMSNPLLTVLRRTFVPVSVRHALKARLSMKNRPELSDQSLHYLRSIFEGK